MSNYSAQIFKVSFITAALLVAGNALAAQAPNPRSSGAVVNAAASAGGRGDARDATVRTPAASATTASRSATRRPATAKVSRAATTTPKVVGAITSARSAATQRTVSASKMPAAHVSVGRAASSGVVRSAVPSSSKSVRSAKTPNASRAATARATAVFENISAIGGGYATCREAYATCMDQFCANANDTYRRCFCSSRFSDFRDAEDAMDQARVLLQQFEDNNLNAIDKTAAEVDAMYSASIGEAAIKKDTSAAAGILSEIDDLLAGKKKTTKKDTTTSLGLINVDFSNDVDDIWSGGGNSLFSNTSSGQDLSQLEGQKLFDSANSQCLKIVASSCENDAVLTMARSAYGILISQDCNLYEKKINSKKESVAQTVRQAEKVLRDARLEEYRAHNSQDVNECLDKVKTAITQELACGENYKRCLDYGGGLIDTMGNPVYSPRLVQLTDQINLNGNSDVLTQNPDFVKFLDSKKMFAEQALDTCRDKASIVWEEFKRSALIEIAQAQDAKIEEIKMSCVNTIASCYDSQSEALIEMDTTTGKYSGALGAQAAKYMCRDKVVACAALYGNTSKVVDGKATYEECKFDNKGRILNAKTCGLSALLSFVDAVDETRIDEGCETALLNKLKDDCTPTGNNSTYGYPWNCRLRSYNDLETLVGGYAKTYCGSEYVSETGKPQNKAANVWEDFVDELQYQLSDACQAAGGYWLEKDAANNTENLILGMSRGDKGTLVDGFYRDVFAGNKREETELTFGRCITNDAELQCAAYNADGKDPVATFDRARSECVLADEWYKSQCENVLDGYYESGVCYVEK